MKEIIVDKELESVTGGTDEFADFSDITKIKKDETILHANDQTETETFTPNITNARYRF